MIFKRTNGWFIFSFENIDYKKYGRYKIKKFLNEIISNIEIKDRNYFNKNKEWQIRDIHLDRFRVIYNQHFNINQQLNIKI